MTFEKKSFKQNYKQTKNTNHLDFHFEKLQESNLFVQHLVLITLLLFFRLMIH